MRPLLETAGAAFLIGAAAYLYIFGVHARFDIPRQWQDVAALVALILGCWIAAGLWAAYPAWRKPFFALTGVLLAGVGVLASVVFGGIIRW
jgi:peptidoglycan biosynthesis protein MviN/MurJ (putative lipid II flippase)